MNMKLSITSAMTVALLAGCASDDPRQGGLLGGLIGLGSGSYQQRIDAEEAALDADQARYRSAVTERERLDQAVAARRAEADDLSREVASLEQDVAALDDRITSLRYLENVTLGDVEQAEAGVAQLVTEIDRIETAEEIYRAGADGLAAAPETGVVAFEAPEREQVTALRAYIERLQEAVDALKAVREMREATGVPRPASRPR